MPPAKLEPGRDPEMFTRTQKLNVLFALSSIGLLLAFTWMIWADYDRGWKHYQTEFSKLEVKTTESQIAALSQSGAVQIQSIQAELKKGDEEIAARQKDVNAAQAEVDRLKNGAVYRTDQNFRFTKAEIDVARYEYEDAALHKQPSTDKKKAHLAELEKRWAELRIKRDEALALQSDAEAKLKELEKTRLDAEAKQKASLGDLTRLQDKLGHINPVGFNRVVTLVRNLPVLDMANPSLRINQIMPANLFDDVILTVTPKVDRCTTCHLGIDKKGYEKADQPYRSHPDIDLYLRGGHAVERIGCTACHQGRGRATSFVNAVHTPATKEQEKDWGKYTHSAEYERWHQWDQPMLAKGHTESQCAKCHAGNVEVPRADKLNTGNFLIEKYGCFGCHKIKGWENLRKVGPDLTKVTSKTNEEWIFRWIKEPRGFRPTRMPQIWDVRTPDQEPEAIKARNNTEANAVVAYVVEKSGRETYPEPPAGDRAAGQKTFESVGCMACHRIGDDKRGLLELDAASFRTHGPNLDGTGSKVNAGWLYGWLRNPKSYWHETRMPNLRLSEKEIADLTAYLMSLKNEAFLGRPRPAIDKSVRDAIIRTEYLEQQFSVTDAKQKLDAMGDHERTLYLGERMIARYGCFGCHTISGFEKTSPIGVELTEEGSKLIERLDFGNLEHEIPHQLPAWVKLKLMDPRIYDRDKPSKKPDELLRMPNFHLASNEADAIVTSVLSLTKEQIPLAAQKQLSADERYVEEGRRLIRSYNCQGCHQIGAQGGTIRAVVEDQLKTSGGEVTQAQALSPPVLYNDKSKIGEGARVHTEWLHGFLKDPSNHVRPWLQLRMPTFDFTEEQLNSITRYFAAQDKVPFPYEPKPSADTELLATGKNLFDKWQCVKCHVVAGKLPNQEPADMAPDLANVPRRLRAEWLSAWLADPGRILPGTRMPSDFPTDAKENAYPEILSGDQKQQIEAVRAYLLTLGGAGTSAGR
jgi:mono/diheme cytochrome c family protein